MLHLLILLLTLCFLGDGSPSVKWERKAAMPTPRSDLAVVLSDVPTMSVLAIGGITDGGALSGAVEMYFPNNTWGTLPSLPTPRENLAATIWKGKLYTFGGLAKESPDGDSTLVEVLDLGTLQWSKGPPLPENRMGARAVALDAGVLIVGGFTEPYTNRSYHSDSLLFDGNTFVTLASKLPYGRSNMAVCLEPSTNTVYAAGGGALAPSYATVAAFAVSNRTWVPAPPLVSAVSYAGIAAVSTAAGDAFVCTVGGMDGHFDPTDVVQCMSVTDRTWHAATALPVRRGGMSACTFGQFIVVAGGTDTFLGGIHNT